MRELKFRAWDNLHKEMIVTGFHVFGEYTLFNLIGQYCFETKGNKSSLERYDDIVVTQYTGLEDKNEKEIYEGDVVKCGYGVGIVVFNAGCFMVEWIDDKEAYMEFLFSRKEMYARKDDELFEIVGNIYENPELITNET